MHLIRLSEVNQSEKLLTQAVLQVTQMLGLFNAELARILRVQCQDVGLLTEQKKHLDKTAASWQYAEQLVTVYECLYEFHNGDEVLIYNWIRRQQAELNAVPLYLMVDELQTESVIHLLRKALSK